MGFMKRKKQGIYNGEETNRKATRGKSAQSQKGSGETSEEAALAKACPYCGAAAGEPCLTSSGYATSPHASRLR